MTDQQIETSETAARGLVSLLKEESTLTPTGEFIVSNIEDVLLSYIKQCKDSNFQVERQSEIIIDMMKLLTRIGRENTCPDWILQEIGNLTMRMPEVLDL